ncbi:glycine zipper domain-containing protein [Albimonas pacifica]|uniref:Membrane-anchored ribosome-binding protein, inhibits growth in stationary phase, ElaB/YqjD/DUF883 family n=1 Tax=Albimonas pacifica TaxID=1114924 RepID=A0A1I3FJP3_9RHOB|nr:DUF883 family protein [Albimonas pacifica]SFI11445.1 Membrane-anchored ribosome-binding protein, inhibits growth in stationary phase, ElaB/YqjD/DUF883 family [Albimonas pacifica]
MATAPTDDKYAELSKQIDALRADLSRITETMGDVARMEVEDAKGRVNGAAREAQARGRRAARRARAEAERDIEVAQDYVRERPLTAVAGAAALGLVFGFLTARR